jgi:hypothetical protein
VEIADFAQHYGVFDLCEHANRPGHCPNGCAGGSQWPGRQPLATWREYSRRLRELLSLTMEYEDPDIPLERWAVAFGREDSEVRVFVSRIVPQLGWDPDDEDTWERPEVGRILMTFAVDRLLMAGGVRASLMHDRRFELKLVAENPLGVAAIQLAHRVMRGATLNLATCDGCNRTFISPRKPRADRAKYCTRCQKAGIPARNRGRRHRARKR